MAAKATPWDRYPDERRAAEYILRHGWLTVAEIADGLGVSRQLVRHWAKRSNIDYQAKRARWLDGIFKRAKRESRHGVQKNGSRHTKG